MFTVDTLGWWLVTAKETESYYLGLNFVCHTVNQSQVENSPSPNLAPFPSDLCSSRSADRKARIESILA